MKRVGDRGRVGDKPGKGKQGNFLVLGGGNHCSKGKDEMRKLSNVLENHAKERRGGWEYSKVLKKETLVIPLIHGYHAEKKNERHQL